MMHSGTRRFTAYTAAFALAALIALLAPSPASANIGGSTAGGGGCGGGPCHGNVTGGLTVSVSGLATVLPNSTNTYTLTFAGQTNLGGGLSVETDAGTLQALDANTQLLGGMITHTGANVGDWTYNFDFTAPASIGTTITLAFSGVDFDAVAGANPGDDWNVGTFVITTVIPEPDTALLLGMGLGILGIVGRRRTA
jgi:hypothetical protein